VQTVQIRLFAAHSFRSLKHGIMLPFSNGSILTKTHPTRFIPAFLTPIQASAVPGLFLKIIILFSAVLTSLKTAESVLKRRKIK
jgi:hypothetical protein